VAPILERLAEPAMRNVKNHIRQTLIAVAAIGTGVACLIAGLSYFASSLWHALAPHLGNVGADLVLGCSYAMAAVALIAWGLRSGR
jgi:hypothetical protein